MRRKLRWILSSPDGEQLRSGLSFGQFDDAEAIARATSAAAPADGDTLDVFIDGVHLCSLRAPIDAHATH
jgi:hypothetical protein